MGLDDQAQIDSLVVDLTKEFGDRVGPERVRAEVMARVGLDPWLVVDLSTCSYVDSAGLSVIARVDARCREVLGGLRLVVVAESGVDRVLAMTRLNSLLNVDRSIEEALEAAAEEDPKA